MDSQELLKMISVLLLYPDDEICSIDWEIEWTEVEDNNLKAQLKNFIDYFSHTPLQKLQETYVSTFDFNDKNSLYFSYSLYGDERERGRFLAELKQMYEDSELEFHTTELPDYIPLFLEFLSWSDLPVSGPVFQDFRKGVEQTSLSLAASQSPYAGLFKALMIVIDQFKLKKVLS